MKPPRHKRGLLVVLSGASGSGKTTICRKLMERGDYERSVSATTRPARPGECDGVDYHFLSREEFLNRLEQGYFVEHAEYCGNVYGSPKEPIERALAQGRTIFLVIEVQGAKQIKQQYPDAMLVFIEAPSGDEASKRLEGRKSETQQEIEERLRRAAFEAECAAMYDYHVVNDNLNRAVGAVKEIIERERRPRTCGTGK